MEHISGAIRAVVAGITVADNDASPASVCPRCGGAPEQTLHVETGQAWRFAFRHKTGCRLFDPSVYFYADAIPADAGRT